MATDSKLPGFSNWDQMDTESKFKSAVKVIRGLPEDGPYQPSQDLKLKLYGLYKQATEGPCKDDKPAFYEIVKGYKWRAWKNLGSISKTEAMTAYVEELKKIIETMSYNHDVENFVDTLGPFYEFVDVPTKTVGENLEKMKLNDPDNSEKKNNNDRFQMVNGHSINPLSSSSEEDEQGLMSAESMVSVNGVTSIKTEIVESTSLVTNQHGGSDSETDSEDEYSEPAETLDTLVRSTTVNTEKQMLIKMPLDVNTSDIKVQEHGGGDLGAPGNRRKTYSGSDGGGSKYSGNQPEYIAGKGLSRTGSGGRRPPQDPKRTKGLPDEIGSQLVFILGRIHEDLQGIITRLETLEAQSPQNLVRCSTCKHKKDDDSAVKRWWPFPELSPRSTFFLLTWPLILSGAIKMFVLLRLHRRRKAN